MMPHASTLFDVYTAPVSHPDNRTFLMRAPATTIERLLPVHRDGVRRFTNELIAEGKPESKVFMSRGEWSSKFLFITWCGR